jgi:hypothetical protein
MCGGKQIRRLFNKIGILTGRRPDRLDPRSTSSSHAVRTDAMVEGPISAVLQKRDELKASGQRWRNDNGMVRTVPLRQLPQALTAVYQGHQPVAVDQSAFGRQGSREERLKAAQSGQHNEVVESLVGRSVPSAIEARDTEFKIVKGKHGPEVGRA